MIRNTFVHVPGVGIRTERKLWASGIVEWRHALDDSMLRSVGSQRASFLRDYISKSLRALERRDSLFFSRLAKMGQVWRAYEEFEAECIYLDIETTGLFASDAITVIGASNGQSYKVFVAGKDLEKFPEFLRTYKYVVTFNGAQFDLPFLKRTFNRIQFPLHLDLRWAGRKAGFNGGLKAIEDELGLKRNKEVRDLDGFDAVLLWRRHLRGDRSALPLLIKYNEADVQSLVPIAKKIVKNLAQHGPVQSQTRIMTAGA